MPAAAIFFRRRADTFAMIFHAISCFSSFSFRRRRRQIFAMLFILLRCRQRRFHYAQLRLRTELLMMFSPCFFHYADVYAERCFSP